MSTGMVLTIETLPFLTNNPFTHGHKTPSYLLTIHAQCNSCGYDIIIHSCMVYVHRYVAIHSCTQVRSCCHCTHNEHPVEWCCHQGSGVFAPFNQQSILEGPPVTVMNDTLCVEWASSEMVLPSGITRLPYASPVYLHTLKAH